MTRDEMLAILYPRTDYVGIRCERCGELLTHPADSADDFVYSGKCGACLGRYSRLVGKSASGNDCSWCLDAYRIPADPRESHGICARHLAGLKAEIEARRARAMGGV